MVGHHPSPQSRAENRGGLRPGTRRGTIAAMHRLLSALSAVTLMLTACSATPRNPECKRAYDACTDRCGAVCERPSRIPMPEEPTGERTDTWSSECDDCVNRCLAAGRRCDARHSRP